MSDSTGPAWDLSTEYTAPADPRVEQDLAALSDHPFKDRIIDILKEAGVKGC